MRLRVLLATTLATLAVGCGVGGSSEGLGDAVHDAAASGRSFRLEDVTDFEWDRFYAVPPYSSPKAIERQLGFEWGDAVHSDSRMSDAYTLLVFVHDGEVVKAYDQEGGDGHFECIGRRGLTPGEAVLRVYRERAGGEILDYVIAGSSKRPPSCPI